MKRSLLARKLKVAKKGNPLIAEIITTVPDDILTSEYMANLLYKTGAVLLNAGPLNRVRCSNIMDALVVFVAFNPPSVATNLFLADQVSKINPWKVLDYSATASSTRNWQYVFAIINRFINDGNPEWLYRDGLLVMVSQKSNAVTTGEIMSTWSDETAYKTENHAALVIAFWIAKLYSVSVYRCQPQDLPNPIRDAYFKFLKWQGAHWDSKVPVLNLQNKFLELDEVLWCFPFAQETLLTLGSKKDVKTEDSKAPKEREELFLQMCNFLGENRLCEYLSLHKGSLLDFYTNVFQSCPDGSKPQAKHVSSKVTKVSLDLMEKTGFGQNSWDGKDMEKIESKVEEAIPQKVVNKECLCCARCKKRNQAI